MNRAQLVKFVHPLNQKFHQQNLQIAYNKCSVWHDYRNAVKDPGENILHL